MNEVIYTNGVISGTLAEIEYFLQVMSELSFRVGHPVERIQELRDSIYDQFHVPHEKRSVFNIVRIV